MDSRSRKVIFLAHCILNQNSVVLGLARRPAAFKEVVTCLMEKDVGIIQMKCPETTYAGLLRFQQSVEQYSNPFFREHCRKIAVETVKLAEEYLRCGYKVLGIVGIKGSPSCGVSLTTSASYGGPPEKRKERKIPKPGVFIEELSKLLSSRELDLKLLELDPKNPAAFIDTIETLKQA